MKDKLSFFLCRPTPSTQKNLANLEAGDSYTLFHMTLTQTTSICSSSKEISSSAKRMLFTFSFSKIKVNYVALHNDISIYSESLISSMPGNFSCDCQRINELTLTC